MDKQLKLVLYTLAFAVGVVWLTKPKGLKAFQSPKFSMPNKYSEPKVASDTDLKLKENAVIGMQAVKNAMLKKEPKKEIDKLTAMVYKEYGLKIMANKNTGKLRAMSKEGKVIAEEA